MKQNITRKPMRVVSCSRVLKYEAQSAKDADKRKVCANGSKKPVPIKLQKSTNVSNNTISQPQKLFKAVMKIFKQQQCDKLRTRDLIAHLCSNHSKKWLTYNKGKEITARQLGGLLKPFSVTSHDLYFADGNAKGYLRKELKKAYRKMKELLLS